MSVKDNIYGALLQHVYKFCWRVAACCGKSADLILQLEPTLLEQCMAIQPTTNQAYNYSTLGMIFASQVGTFNFLKEKYIIGF
jgi:hypothetical protein